ncbi:histidine phosphatase family protein [Agrobacterium rubi]|uniref:Phosphoglycerate mutase family protein n=1 Tax=Agrobacterium rubi TR3 = NBRC 13261 TaxID=1368415 RepID=A0A081D1T4_9HYPH|nr:histidine phosphatase family protein [Agrobacterium rubi]MBP1881171.1 putative phosphoglycerate mutase [Agrobacterium rubi]MCL6654530.1 phosphatase [Agrobacterium rubi]NTF09295.1 histidine phosphatase family protein [Agrobacterium rubi]NTF22204.1 histidine phosphatase family protein [Agrobacterium rubi]NTF29061.1 histidine phosphatase family protein [Agrobacterium rubi]
MKRILLVRHGESEWNAIRRLQGQADINLSQRGEGQARALRPMIATYKPDLVLTSDLMRASHTASLLGYPDATRETRLREHNVGDWTGAEIAQLMEEQPEAYANWRAGTFAPDNGELWEDFRSRVASVIDMARSSQAETILMVCHGGVIRAALHATLQLPPARIIPVGPASLTILAFPKEEPRLEVFNATIFAPVLDAPD